MEIISRSIRFLWFALKLRVRVPDSGEFQLRRSKYEVGSCRSHLPKSCKMRCAILIFLSCALMQSANAEVTQPRLTNAINELNVCEQAYKDTGKTQNECGYNAIFPVLQQLLESERIYKDCTSVKLLENKHIKSITSCKTWMKDLQPKKVVVEKDFKSNTFGSLEGNQSLRPPALQATTTVVGASSAPEQAASTPERVDSTSNSAFKQNPVATKTIDAATPALSDRLEQASNTYLTWILGILVIVLAALIVVLYLKLNKVALQYSESEMKRERDNKKKNEEIRRLVSDRDRALMELEASKSSVALQKSVVAAGASISMPRMVAPVAVPETPAIPKAAAPQLSRLSVQQAILKAIDVLANERASLTEANFVSKIVGSITNPDVKAALTGNLEPGQFFLCGGTRSAQGPELLAYRLKGADAYDVVPFPTAGRVGQFMRWYENAVGSYEVDPVLASKPAIGVINEAGVLSVSQKGLLA